MRWAVAVEENRADGWRLSYLRRFARVSFEGDMLVLER